MSSCEEDELLALRSAAMATMKKSKEEDLGDDPELAALRKAALMTKRQNDRNAAKDGPRHHRPQIGKPFIGTPPFKLAKGSNLIVISTISDEEKEEHRPAPKPKASVTPGPALVRPQDKWLSENSQSSTSSPLRAKVQDKFSRFESSESEEDAGSESESSDDDNAQNNQSQNNSGSDSDSDSEEQSQENSDTENKSDSQSTGESDAESFVTKSELSSEEEETNNESKPEAQSETQTAEKTTTVVTSDGQKDHPNDVKPTGDQARRDRQNVSSNDRTKRDDFNHRLRDGDVKRSDNRDKSRYQDDCSRRQQDSRDGALRGNGRDRFTSKRHLEHSRYPEESPRFPRENRNRDRSRGDDRRRDDVRDRTSREYKSGPPFDDRLRDQLKERSQTRDGRRRRDRSWSRDRNRNTNNKEGAREYSKNGKSVQSDSVVEKSITNESKSDSVKESENAMNNDKEDSSSSSDSSSDADQAESDSDNSTGDEDSNSDSEGRGHRQTFERNTQDIEIERRKRRQQEMELERQKRREEREKWEKAREERREKERQQKPIARENQDTERVQNDRRMDRDQNDRRMNKDQNDRRVDKDGRRGRDRPRPEQAQRPRDRERYSGKPRNRVEEKVKSRSRSRSPVVKSFLSVVAKDPNPPEAKQIQPLITKEDLEQLSKERNSKSQKKKKREKREDVSSNTDLSQESKQKQKVKDARELLRQKRKAKGSSGKTETKQANSDGPDVLVSPELTTAKQYRFRRIEPPGNESARLPATKKRKSEDFSHDDGSPAKKLVEEKGRVSPLVRVTFNEDARKERAGKKSIKDRLGLLPSKSNTASDLPLPGRKPVTSPSKVNVVKRVDMEPIRAPVQSVKLVMDKQQVLSDAKPKTLLDSKPSRDDGAKPKLLMNSKPKPKPIVTDSVKAKTGVANKHAVTSELGGAMKSERLRVEKSEDSRKIVTSGSVARDKRRIVQQAETTPGQDSRHVVKVSSSADSVLDKPTQPARKIKLVRKPLAVNKSSSDTTM